MNYESYEEIQRPPLFGAKTI